MADDASAVSSVENPVSSELHKRKLEDIEAPALSDSTVLSPSKTVADLDTPKEEENVGPCDSEAKRPRLDTGIDVPVDVVSQNGHQEDDQGGEQKDGEIEEGPVVNVHLESEARESHNETWEAGPEVPVVVMDEEKDTGSPGSLEQPKDEVERSAEEHPVEGNVPLAEDQPAFGDGVVSRQMEVPNDKVGVLIGKGGDTIRSLQDNSGAKIQITKDVNADPRSTTRPLELIGTLESITRAEKLIKDVIAEADAGGSASLVARGFSTVQGAGGGEQLELQVPLDKVGLIIGKGGETIRNLQTRSGARIQLIQQNMTEENQLNERTVRVSGNKKQIEIATYMIKDVMNQTTRSSAFSGPYSQQGSHPRGPHGSQWASRGPNHHHGHFSGYDYSQRGPAYPTQNPHMPPPAYGNYPPHQGPRNNFGSTWEQNPQPPIRGSSHQGHYNPDYGHPPHYGQTPAQSYGHGYNDSKYEHHASSQNYGPMGSQTTTPYIQGGGSYSGYGPQDQYGKPPTYGMPQQVPPYGHPRPNQSGTILNQGNITQPYGQNFPPQQSYPYASSGQMQPNYPTYGSGVSTEGYTQQPAAAQPISGYPSQGGQPAAGYVQPATQPAAGYVQPGTTQPAAGYVQPGTQPAAGYVQPGTPQPAAGYVQPGTPQPAAGYVQPGTPQPAAGYVQPGTTQPAAGYVQPGTTQPAAGYAQPGTTQPAAGYAQPGTTQPAAGYAQPGTTQPAAGYAQPGTTQPAAGYAQPGTQQMAAYPQPGSTGGYGSYPAAQPSYAEQPAANTGYGYHGVSANPSYASQGQAAVYVQQSQTQPSYDQSGAYGSAPVPAGYGKSA